MSITIRKIEPKDNELLAKIIRSTFEEFDVPKCGTVYNDPTTDNLYTLFQTPKSIYWVAEEDGVLLGGCGIYPTAKLPDGYAEIAKLYTLTQSRGRGIGKELFNKCIQSAKELGYSQLYLESFPQFERAINMYKRLGFKTICSPLGHSGHTACDIWMVKELVSTEI